MYEHIISDPISVRDKDIHVEYTGYCTNVPHFLAYNPHKKKRKNLFKWEFGLYRYTAWKKTRATSRLGHLLVVLVFFHALYLDHKSPTGSIVHFD